MKPAQPVERLGRDFIFISASVDSSDGKANFQAPVLILKKRALEIKFFFGEKNVFAMRVSTPEHENDQTGRRSIMR
jgi:hypothetical protein